jgi:ribosomal protein S18 acetylase RimI-like enzyme
MVGTAMASVVDIRILGEGDPALLQACANGVFDHSRSPELVAEFLADARHHIVAAIVDGTLVGLVSAVHYVHPDKPPELWINEVSVAESHRGQGIAKRLLAAMLSHGRSLGCTEAWVLTEEDNVAAQRLYASVDGAHRNVVYFTFPLIDSQ